MDGVLKGKFSNGMEVYEVFMGLKLVGCTQEDLKDVCEFLLEKDSPDKVFLNE